MVFERVFSEQVPDRLLNHIDLMRKWEPEKNQEPAPIICILKILIPSEF